MVAEPRSRGKGLASEALILFMLYAINSLVGVSEFDLSKYIYLFYSILYSILILHALHLSILNIHNQYLALVLTEGMKLEAVGEA